MREALDDMDDDDVIGRTASLILGDDYKEVKDRVALACLVRGTVLRIQLEAVSIKTVSSPVVVFYTRKHGFATGSYSFYNGVEFFPSETLHEVPACGLEKRH